MAPHLATSQHLRIAHMNASKVSFTANQIARVAECSSRTIYGRRSRKGCRTSPTPVGRPRSVTPRMLDALRAHLVEAPDLYLEEMVLFLWNKFEVRVTTYSFVFVDESGCDKRAGLRRTGWSPLGVTPVQVSRFKREKRYQILPAYTQDGIIFVRVYQGSTTATVYEEFIEQLLPIMNPWPQRNSVLVMDNASIHHSARIKQMCHDAGVRLVYLPPYSPDLNPIEEFLKSLYQAQMAQL
ncbi:uncharacterized protein RAG0_02848 [Rhynchosporium agropyri]|uniref:Tc1-like transposase DDE domain-containing protein n=1 Tax=Rhynchosporium agropyri TaxID=914238 RepID=A0A1E1K2P6_9HELO|nr:uncharacterized protein RAG0_02848 [Rhynchosporium agropyri]